MWGGVALTLEDAGIPLDGAVSRADTRHRNLGHLTVCFGGAAGKGGEKGLSICGVVEEGFLVVFVSATRAHAKSLKKSHQKSKVFA